MLWHPQEGLWNWRLVDRLRALPGGAALDHAVVLADSVLLAARAMRLRPGRDIDAARVLYLDCGVWRDGKQIRLVHEWLGDHVAHLDVLAFEANPYHHKAASAALADLPGVDLRNVALVGPGQAGTATLYLTRGGEGAKGDSLLRKQEESVDVPAERLSRLLPDLDAYDAVILRMNIEGAEEFVVADLIDAGLVPHVSGFFGMWDDLWKIDRRRAARFQATLDGEGIRPFPFNDRDIEHPFWPGRRRRRLYARIRMWAIRRALRAAIGASRRP